MAPASRVLYLGTKGKRSIDSWDMCQVWMPSNPTNIARKHICILLQYLLLNMFIDLNNNLGEIGAKRIG